MRRCLFALTLLASTASLRAAEKDFLGNISPADRASCGIAHLKPDQLITLDKLANRDITLAREGDANGFAGSFSERRTDEQRKATGIDTLTIKERDNLDALVAQAIADHPMHFQAPAAAPAAPSPKATPSIVLTPPKMEVHGDVTLMAGAGSGGRSFYGTAMDVSMTDPSGKFTLAVGYSVIHSKGFPPCLFDPYNPAYPYLGVPPLLP